MALVDLSNELLISIVESLVSEKDISAFARCNRRIYPVAMSHLYRLNILHSNCSALIWATDNGFADVVRGFFPGDSYPKPSEIVIEEVLLLAAKRGDESITKLLLENGANANGSPLNNKDIPLILAADSGHLPVVRLLVQHGAEIGRLDQFGWCAMSHAVHHGCLGVVKFLGVDQKAVSRWIDKNGRTLLHLAATRGHIEVVKFLIERGANLAATDVKERTPLVWAINNDPNSLRVVETLLSYEISLSIATDRDLALTIAFKTRNADIIKVLLEHGADANHKGIDGLTPLVNAMISKCPLNVIEMLFTHGADVSATDDFQHSLLYWAAHFARIDYIRLLLEKGADRTVYRRDGGTPLHAAAYTGFLEAVELFLDHGTNSTKASNDEIASVSENRTNFDVADCEGRTPLMIAVKYSDGDDYVKIVGLLLEKGADPNVIMKGYKGRPLLYIASKKGAVEIMKLLIDHGAAINVRTKKGYTPLHAAAMWGQKSAVEMLLQKGADFYATDNDGMIALDLAVENSDSDIFMLLYEHHRDLKRSVKTSDRSSKLA